MKIQIHADYSDLDGDQADKSIRRLYGEMILLAVEDVRAGFMLLAHGLLYPEHDKYAIGRPGRPGRINKRPRGAPLKLYEGQYLAPALRRQIRRDFISARQWLLRTNDDGYLIDPDVAFEVVTGCMTGRQRLLEQLEVEGIDLASIREI